MKVPTPDMRAGDYPGRRSPVSSTATTAATNAIWPNADAVPQPAPLDRGREVLPPPPDRLTRPRRRLVPALPSGTVGRGCRERPCDGLLAVVEAEPAEQLRERAMGPLDQVLVADHRLVGRRVAPSAQVPAQLLREDLAHVFLVA
jgi:hypothetical protein